MEQKNASASNDKVMAALSSISLIGLIVYFAVPDASAFVKNYARQGATLFIFNLLIFIPIVNCIVAVVLLVATIILIINALQENQNYQLPVVGDLAMKIFK